MSKILKQFRIWSGVDIPDETLNRWIEEGLEELTPENNIYYICSGKKLILMVLEEDDFINIFVCDVNKDYFGSIKELKNTVKDAVKFNDPFTADNTIHIPVYCSCDAPNTIYNSADGKSFLYCKNCGKEKNGS